MTRVIERNNNKNGSSNNNKANASLSAESVASTEAGLGLWMVCYRHAPASCRQFDSCQ